MRIHLKILITLAVLLAIVLGALGGSWYFYRSSHIKVDGVLYEKDLNRLDLRGQKVSAEQYLHLQEALPDCTILWDVPFQDRVYANDTEKITVTSLSAEDLEMLSYLTELKEVDATGCFDYEMLKLLQQQHPDCRIDYSVALGSQVLPKDAETLVLGAGQGDFDLLLERLSYLPRMQTVTFEEPSLTPAQLRELTEAYPEIRFSWTKTLFGKSMPNDTEKLDISGMKFETVEEIENQAAYLTGLTQLIMCDTGLPNEEIAAYRERVRSDYKVIWNVKIGQFNVRTDETWFMPTKFHKDVKDREMYNMRYCEDMICIDLGHNVIKNVDWVEGTPHLKYLVIADGPLQDITPLGTLKELKFLELFMTDIRDISPILGCTALEDLNVARIPANLRPLAEMTWLKNLWMSGGRVSKEDEAYLREKLPNTNIDAAHHHNCTGRGWRQLQNYIDMRNILDMPIYPE